jgi:uncharacterized coiled-coil DUF342 family protein
MEQSDVPTQSNNEKLDELFKRLKELNETKSKSSSKIKQLISRIKELRILKKKITDIVKTNKTNREEINQKLQKLFSELKPLKQEKEKFGEIGDPRYLQNRINKIEWVIITENIPYEKEQELTKERLLLEEQLKKALERYALQKDERNLVKQVDELKTEQRIFHSNVIANSKEWEKVDKEITGISAEIDKSKATLKPAEDEIKKIRAEIGEHKGKITAVETQSKNRFEVQKKNTILDKFRELKERFKKKKKLTTDDLLVLQSSEEELPLE